jgi:hypothetical protein
MQQSNRSTTAVQAQSKPYHYSLPRDIYFGAVLGDFAPTLGIPGAVTQVILGYVPVIGSVTALRDAAADLKLHDALGVILNLLAIFPVLGGLSKTADVVHTLHRLHRVQHYVVHRMGDKQGETTQRRGYGCLAFLISVVMLALATAYGYAIYLAAQYARSSWPLGPSTPIAGNGPLVVVIGMAMIGLSIGEVICAGSRAWFGVIFLPAALFVGLFILGGGF